MAVEWGVRATHFSRRSIPRFIQKCNEIGLLGGISQIKRFIMILKDLMIYSWQRSTLNFVCKRVLPAFSENLKGVVMQNFSSAGSAAVSMDKGTERYF